MRDDVPARARSQRAVGVRAPAALAALACVTGAALRIALARDAALWGDEFHSLRVWRRALPALLERYDAYGSGLALPILQHLSADLLGETVLAARLPALVGGIAALGLLYPVGRRIVGPWPAALATVGLALSPLHLFYSHVGRSYTLVVALALVLVDGLRRLTERPSSRLAVGEIAVSVALLPWVHLAAAAIAAAGALGGAIAVPRAARRPLAFALALGAVACVAAYVPARADVLRFVEAKAGGGKRAPFGPLDVAAILGGSRVAGLVWMVAVPWSAAAWLRARGAAGAPLAALALVPVAVVAVANPVSNAVAIARYLIGGLPFAHLLLAWGALRAGEAALGGRRGRAVGGALLVVLLVLGAGGPLSSAIARRDVPFSNTYLALQPARALDEPPPEQALFYRDLRARGDVAEVIEVPTASLAAQLLYRAYARVHGKPVRLGALERPPLGIRGAAYVSIEDLAAACDGEVRAVVAHRALDREVADFLTSSAVRVGPRDAAIAEPLVRLPPRAPRLSEAEVAALRARFGVPAYESERLLAWFVSCGDGPG